MEISDRELFQRIKASFYRQGFMQTIGAQLKEAADGEVQIELVNKPELSQHHGYVHAAVLAAIADNACGFAAQMVSPPGVEILTVEYKVNFLRPGRGDYFLASGRVLKPGRKLIICRSEVKAISGEEETLCLAMQSTLIPVPAGE